MANVVCVHWYDITFKGGVAIWEDPIAYLMCVQFLKTNVRSLHFSYCQNFCDG